MKNVTVTLLEWKDEKYSSIECDSLSRAIVMMADDPSLMLLVEDGQSSGQLSISTLTSSPEVISYNF
jgi:hypothetical protein